MENIETNFYCLFILGTVLLLLVYNGLQVWKFVFGHVYFVVLKLSRMISQWTVMTI